MDRRLAHRFSSVAALIFSAPIAGCLLPIGSPRDGGLTCSLACVSGQTCDPRTGNCVAALVEGQICPGADGGLCAPPLSCGQVTVEETRCSIECTAKSAPDVCANGQSCYARPGNQGGFCVTPANLGAACDTSQLVMCLGTELLCVARSPSSSAGQCFEVCDPAVNACGGGESCADPWAPQNPTLGICVQPQSDGTCDYSQLHFCPRGDTCAVAASSTRGFCHVRCAPQTIGGCAPTEQCLVPWPTTPDQGICVTPQPVGSMCSASLDLWCGQGDLCIYVPGFGTSCAVDCTNNAAACNGSGKVCRTLGDGHSACV